MIMRRQDATGGRVYKVVGERNKIHQKGIKPSECRTITILRLTSQSATLGVSKERGRDGADPSPVRVAGQIPLPQGSNTGWKGVIQEIKEEFRYCWGGGQKVDLLSQTFLFLRKLSTKTCSGSAQGGSASLNLGKA